MFSFPRSVYFKTSFAGLMSVLAICMISSCGGGGGGGGEDETPTPPSPGLERISQTAAGEDANSHSTEPALDASGRFVAFNTNAFNLHPVITGTERVLVHDRNDGSFFRADTSLAEEGSYKTFGPKPIAISGSGQFIFFSTRQDTLIADDNNDALDIYFRDSHRDPPNPIWRASLDNSGNEANGDSLRPDATYSGRYVVYDSHASNLVDDDTNGEGDVFLSDILNYNRRMSLTDGDSDEADGQSWDPAIDDDGRLVVFTTNAGNLGSPFGGGRAIIVLRDWVDETTTVVSTDASGVLANASSDEAEISGDGTHVVFTSSADNLVAGDTNGVEDIFVKNLATGAISRVSVDSDGAQGNGDSGFAELSADGRYVVFTSVASNLVSDDANGMRDAFVHDRVTGITRRVSEALDGTEGNGEAGEIVAISADGSVIAFSSSSSNLVIGDDNGEEDVFVAIIPPAAGG